MKILWIGLHVTPTVQRNANSGRPRRGSAWCSRLIQNESEVTTENLRGRKAKSRRLSQRRDTTPSRELCFYCCLCTHVLSGRTVSRAREWESSFGGSARVSSPNRQRPLVTAATACNVTNAPKKNCTPPHTAAPHSAGFHTSVLFSLHTGTFKHVLLCCYSKVGCTLLCCQLVLVFSVFMVS